MRRQKSVYSSHRADYSIVERMITAKTSTNGQIVIPEAIRQRHKIKKGDTFEFIEGDEPNVILMRKINGKANGSLLAALRACPHPFEVPVPSREPVRPPKL